MNQSLPTNSETKLGKSAALTEIVCVFFLGSILASLMFQLAGIKGHPLAALTTENPDMFAISWQTAKVLLMQYAGWIVLALAFIFWRRKQPLKMSGVSLNQHTWLYLILFGIGAWAVGDLINKILWVVDAEYDLGTSVPWREALLNADKTAGWWTLMAVGSFALVPILEEVFWRGYVQARLQQSYSPVAAIVISATMFTFSHGQYHQLDLYHAFTIVGVFFSSLIIGWTFYKTGSLVPAIVMHAILNFPTEGIFSYLTIAVMTLIIALNWKAIYAQWNAFKSKFASELWQVMEYIGWLLLFLLMLSLTQAPTLGLMVGYAAVPLAVVLTWIYLKKSKAVDM